MLFLKGPLEAVTWAQIDQLCADQVSEGTELELKSDLPTRDGGLHPWHSGGQLAEYARNQIAEEIIAFANTLGGVVCVGVTETSDHPKRADSPNPLPRVHDLARRLRQSIYEIIDPPLPVFEGAGVEFQGDTGVVLLRVPQSRRRPHRHQVSKEVFVRRNDETVRIAMREIQELTIQSVAEATRIETTIAERRGKFRNAVTALFAGQPVAGFHVFAIPTTAIDLGRVVGRPRLTSFSPKVTAHISGAEHVCAWPWSPEDWNPGLRSIVSTFKRDNSTAHYSLRTDGTCELEFTRVTVERFGLFVGWLVGALGFMLSWMDRVRSEAGMPVEFACAIEVAVGGRPYPLIQYGANNFSDGVGATLPLGFHELPLVSVGAAEEFPVIIRRFDEDLWDLAGYCIRRTLPSFSLS